MIELKGIEKTYQKESVVTPVLKGISFRVDGGEYVSIMGESGSGKSTVLNVLGLLDKPTGGHYLLDGTETVNLGDDERSHLRNQC